ncbi:MAG: hypothetical protein QHH09_03285 [Microgenomates group bacterium]|nr:hypothetical protein [Microgenomates group bacterium]
MFYLLIFVNILLLMIFFLSLPHLPPQIPLFYSKPWGEDQLGENWMIFLLIFLLDLFYLTNIFIVKKFFSDNLFVKKVVSYFNLFLIISLSLIFIKIISLVI